MRFSGESAMGAGLLEVGDYLFTVDSCKATKASTGTEGFEVELSVVSGNVENQQGKQIKAYLYGARVFKFAAAIGMTNKLTGQVFTAADHEQLVAALKAKQPVGEFEFDPQEAGGSSLQCDVVMGQPKPDGHKHAGKSFPELGMNMRAPAFDASQGEPVLN